jgi:hypothetical protein
MILPGVMRRGVNHFAQTIFAMRLLRLAGGSKSYAAWMHAQEYYESQRPLVMQSAKHTNLTVTFEPMAERVWAGMSFYNLVAQRADVMLENMHARQWTDFRIEKNKCDMFSFIANNGFPHCPIFQAWDNLAKFKEEGQQVRKEKCANSPLCFVKMCHITMGHLNSALAIKQKTKWKDVDTWADNLWNQKPIDWDRTWGPTFDKLTATLEPSVLMQGMFSGGRKEGDGSAGTPVELKVDVILRARCIQKCRCCVVVVA